jgi:type 2 lantibiotic biosynthesis protein LanM
VSHTIDFPTTLTRIVERAAFLHERLSGTFVPDPNPEADSPQQIEQRLERWQQVTANRDPERFARRLAWDQLPLEAVRPALGDVKLKPGEALPEWAGTLQAVMREAEALAAGESLPPDRALLPETPLPFESIWLPFVQVARERLRALSGVHYVLLSERAQIALEQSLLQALAWAGQQTLHMELMTYSFQARPLSLFDAAPPEDVSPSTQLYDAFVHKLLADGLAGFFLEYSVLARLLVTITDCWIAAADEFLRHLVEDAADLRRVFAIESDLTAPGCLADLTLALSDPHHNRRSVIKAHFADGTALIYKPRDLHIDRAYDAFLDWLNGQGLSTPLKRLKVLARPAHGWVEAVKAAPCRDQAEARRYYRRAGMLVGLFYVFNAGDFHCENLIANGEYPIPIDMEMLLNPEFAQPGDSAEGEPANDHAGLVARQLVNSSVLGSGLLPSWERWGREGSIDVSALGNIGRSRRTYKIRVWKDINTDVMRLVEEERPPLTTPPPNAATLDGAALDPRDYLGEIVAGFQEMGRLFIDRREALLAPGGPLSLFKGLRVRFLLRSTNIYYRLLQQASAPSLMRCGVDRSLELEALAKGFLLEKTRSVYWPVMADERRALELLDIPLFTLDTEQNALYDVTGGLIENAFRLSAYGVAVATLRGLDERVLAQQTGFCRAAFYAWAADISHGRAALPQDAPKPAGDFPLLTPDQMVEEAIRLAALIEQGAIVSGDTASWITLEHNARINRTQLRPLQYDLYSGGAGVGLFLAALAMITGEKRYGRLAWQAFRNHLENPQTAVSECIGAASGLGSLVYALVSAGRFLEDTRCWEGGKTIARYITPEHITANTTLDVIGGSAGAILGLTALHRVTGDEKSLELALLCGQRLLSQRTASASGQRAWATLKGQLLTGFSHGAAGIAYALVRLFEASGESVYREAAEEAIAYESSVFVESAGNWPDYRAAAQPAFMTSWCHGAPGIVLARLGGLRSLDNATVRRDIEAGLVTTERFGQETATYDFVCCGTAGRIETLLKAGLVLNDTDRLATARQSMSGMVGRAAANGGYLMSMRLPDSIQSLGFFQGLSGIGYELLRLACPEQVPGVLLWE